MGDMLKDILRAADKHPNSKVSKLIRTVEEEPSQKNIVLLLIELSEHAEYSIDFNISLRYYLEIYENLGIDRDLMLNEAGLLLVNSSKIYSKRVDYVQSLVERQIMTLSNADQELQKQKQLNEQSSSENPTPTEKPKRGRKRALDAPTDPYEVQLEPKKIKKITAEKRFTPLKTTTKIKPLQRNIEVEQPIHPAGWMHATIYDLENDEEVDTKRNYKLFTYHIEHRYNTLVPDINFRLHFKVKDYMDAQEEEMVEGDHNQDQQWPPLSEEYIQKYISLENRVLQHEIDPTSSYHSPRRTNTPSNSAIVIDTEDNEQILVLNETVNNMDKSMLIDRLDTTLASENSINESGIGSSILESSMDTTQSLDKTANESTLNNTSLTEDESNKSLNDTRAPGENDSALGESLLDESNNLSKTSSLEMSQLNESANLTTELGGENGECSKNEAGTGEQSANKTLEITENVESSSVQNLVVIDETVKNSETQNMESNVNTDSASAENITENSLTGTKEATEIRANAENSTENSSTESKEGTEISKSAEMKDAEQIAENSLSEAKQGPEVETNKNSESSTVEEMSTTTNTLGENTNAADLNVEKITVDGSGISAAVIENGSPLTEEQNKIVAGETTTDTNATEAQKLTLEENKPAEGATTVEKDGFIHVEIHVMDGNEKEPSERLHLKMSNTDDEGVHFSDDDFPLHSPTIQTSALPFAENNKNITILLEKEVREAIEMPEGMDVPFGHETYKVPVVVEPKEYPLELNIFKLPSKLVRRKILFKLGPDMDLFLKARSMKPIRPVPPPREYRLSKKFQLFALNNTDMTGIMDTPPNSPGHCSDFCGFTDDEDTCTEFCGFSDDEQRSHSINTHRLSRDSGVGTDVTPNLTPEKEKLETIFEEIHGNIENCKVNFNKEFHSADDNGKQTTEALLNDLSTDIRNALETEIQEKESAEGNTVLESVSDLSADIRNALEAEMQDVTIENKAMEATNSDSVINATEENEANKTDKVEQTDNQVERHVVQVSEIIDGTTITPENESLPKDITDGRTLVADKETTDVNAQTETSQEVTDLINAIENQLKVSEDETNVSIEQMTASDEATKVLAVDEANTTNVEQLDGLAAAALEENQETPIAVLVGGDNEKVNSIPDKNSVEEIVECIDNIPATTPTDNLGNSCDNDNNQEDSTMLDLNLEGAKTKIQQWHEHLRPILAKSRERHHFDVFQIGTEILGTIHTADTELFHAAAPAATFGDIMENKDKSYVSRYFLSTLLLANQSNVNISVANKSSENPSSWSDINLKLLSTKRHTVAIEDNIGMISNNKRKSESAASEDKITKKKTKQLIVHDEDSTSSEDGQPLVKFKTCKKLIKRTATKRPMDCDTINIAEKRLRETLAVPLTSTTPQQANFKESLIAGQEQLSMHYLDDMPMTSKQAAWNSTNCEVNLNNIRILQSIEKVPSQGDDYDSGVFSMGEISS